MVRQGGSGPVFDAIAADADPSGVVVTRASGTTSTHSATGIQNGAAVSLRPGDRITVKRSAYASKVAYIFGQVGRPGPVAFPPDGRLDLMDAIAKAGNCTELGNSKSVKINRNGQVTAVNLKEMTEKGSQPYFLQPEDIVTVPTRIW